MKRKIFSKKDGTTFKEDVADISDDVRAWFEHVPIEIKRLLAPAEDFVHGVEHLNELLKDGMPLNEAIENTLAFFNIDDKLYQQFKLMLEVFAVRAMNFISSAESKIFFFEQIAGSVKRDAATDALMQVTKADKVEADTAIQFAVYALKKIA